MSSNSKEAPSKEQDGMEFGTIVVHGATYTTTIPSKYKNRPKWTPPNVKALKSFIPGTIVKLSIKTGDRVETDTPLLVFEAMKMLNQYIAPFPGVIKSVNVKEGDRVPKGFVMIEYE